MHVRRGTALLVTFAWLLLIPPFSAFDETARGDEYQSAPVTTATAPFVVHGRLRRVTTAVGVRPRYTILGTDGLPMANLIPQPSLAMDPFVGQLVSVVVRMPNLQQGRETTLWVDQITPMEAGAPNGAQAAVYRGDSRRATVRTSYEQPVQNLWMAPPAVTATSPYLSEGCQVASAPPPDWFWLDAQYLLWWTSPMTVPALVTTSPAGTPREDAGVLGQPGTEVLFGNSNILSDARHGLRLRLGTWFDKDKQFGIQGDVFGFTNDTTDFYRSGDESGNPILARPFFNANPRDPFTLLPDPPVREDSQLVSYPGVLTGSISVNAKTSLGSAGIAMRGRLASDLYGSGPNAQYSRVDFIAGYRYVRLKDRLSISEDLSSLDPVNPVSFDIFDRFEVRNDFHGADFGMAWQTGWDRWSLECLLKTAIGNVRQTVDIEGGTTITEPNIPVETYVGGLLTQQSNIGHYTQDRFAVVPELGVNVGYEIFQGWHFTAGYTLFFWSNVARAGDQINRIVNPDQLPPPIVPSDGPLQPEFTFRETHFWGQGLNLGFEGRW